MVAISGIGATPVGIGYASRPMAVRNAGFISLMVMTRQIGLNYVTANGVRMRE